jgi:L-rhamnose isomerase/sugar isomerase
MTVVSGRAASARDLHWAVSGLEVETPPWGYANSGTRFKVFLQPGVPRDPFEKIEDAATVGHYTGVAKAIALHIPWDRVDDFSALAAFARERGVKIGGINSSTFQDEDYKLGSLCHPTFEVRKKAVTHILDCCEIARQTGSSVVTVWLADGTNYPGQDDFRARRRRLIDCLREIHPALPEGARLFLEYEFNEPAFYQTDVQDWGAGAQRVPAGWRASAGVRRHRPPRDGREYRADRGHPAPGGATPRLRPERTSSPRCRP